MICSPLTFVNTSDVGVATRALGVTLIGVIARTAGVIGRIEMGVTGWKLVWGGAGARGGGGASFL